MDSLLQVFKKKERCVIGVMSGTSLDGIDLVAVRLSGSGLNTQIDPLHFTTYDMPANWRKRIQNAFKADTEEICRINFDLGQFFGQLICQFCDDFRLSLEQVDVIGCHGQTLFHVDHQSTLQSGEADVIASMTKTVVVADFRTADIAVGGSGAPLVPYLDQILFKDRKEAVALQNIGGIGNVTYLPEDLNKDIIAFDTGPANAILNELVEIISEGKYHFDRDAYWSNQGKVNKNLLEDLIKHDYFTLPLPKSTGREEFGKEYVMSILNKYARVSKIDILRTFVSLVTQSITMAYRDYFPGLKTVYISGGGAHHPTILAELQHSLQEMKVEKLDEINGVSVDSKEAIAFAVLAHERLNNTPANIPSVTGAHSKTTLGKISIPYKLNNR